MRWRCRTQLEQELGKSLIVATDLERRFDDEIALDGVSLEVRAGEIHAVVGLNGAGKTTLMRILVGMARADSGTATILGNEVTSAPSSLWSKVGHSIEFPFAYPELTVVENLSIAAELHGIPRPNVADLVSETIDKFELAHWKGRRARKLSLGNRQRVGLAAAVLHDPSVLVLDEPTNALDPSGVVFVRDMLADFASRGSAILVSSHHLDEVARIADRITVLHRGRIVGSLAPGEMDLEKRFFDMVYSADQAMVTDR
jgi:ABC-2 type transport system ATP-binding protein